MSLQAEKQARAEAMLGELAEHGLMVAKDLAVRLRECEDLDQAVALANAFQKASRVVRLTLALDFKLDRDAAREARARAQEEARDAETARIETAKAEALAVSAAPAPPPGPVETRKNRVRALMNRLIWNEAEGDADEYDILLDDLAARLDEAARSVDFETLPVETLAQRVIADMGLSGGLSLSVCEGAVAPARMADGVARRPDG